MNFQKVGAVASLASFVIGGVVVYLMWKAQSAASPEGNAASSPEVGVQPFLGVFLAGLVVSGILNLSAAMIQAKASRRPQPEPEEVFLPDTLPARFTHGRTFVKDDVTPKFLHRLLENHSDAEAEKLLEAYLGKWMMLSGLVNEVTVEESRKEVYVAIFPPGEEILVSLNFTLDWRNRLSRLLPGNNITVVGVITKVDRISITMNDCELVHR